MHQPKHSSRFSLLSLIALLLITLTAGVGQAAEGVFTVVIYDGVPGVFDDVIDGFQSEMAELGYVEGEHVTYVIASNGEELTAALNEGVDLIVSIPGGIMFSSGVVVRDMPIVFVASRDPVADRLVASLEAPGGPITGVMIDSAVAGRFGLLLALVPDAETVFVVYDSGDSGAEEQIASLESLAETLQIDLALADAPAGDQKAAEAAVELLTEDVDAIFLLELGPVTDWPRFAVEHKLPLVSNTMVSPMDYGALLAYVPDMVGMGADAAGLADQILQGANPGELAVVKAQNVIVLDQRIADLVEVEIPQELLEQAAVVFNVEMVGELPPLEAEASETGGETGGAAGSEAGGAACNAILNHPGGKHTICINAACDVPLDSGMIRYTEREPAESCGTEGLIGICSMPAFDMYHYDGKLSAVQRGCMMLQGEWINP